jgi:hypothetical protein
LARFDKPQFCGKISFPDFGATLDSAQFTFWNSQLSAEKVFDFFAQISASFPEMSRLINKQQKTESFIDNMPTAVALGLYFMNNKNYFNSFNELKKSEEDTELLPFIHQ